MNSSKHTWHGLFFIPPRSRVLVGGGLGLRPVPKCPSAGTEMSISRYQNVHQPVPRCPPAGTGVPTKAVWNAATVITHPQPRCCICIVIIPGLITVSCSSCSIGGCCNCPAVSSSLGLCCVLACVCQKFLVASASVAYLRVCVSSLCVFV